MRLDSWAGADTGANSFLNSGNRTNSQAELDTEKGFGMAAILGEDRWLVDLIGDD